MPLFRKNVRVERLVLRVVTGKDFLHMKINNKDVYIDYGATTDIPEDACSLKLYGDLTAFNCGK